MGIEKRTYSFRLDEEFVTQLHAYAAEENHTLSNLVETILKRYVAEREDKESE